MRRLMRFTIGFAAACALSAAAFWRGTPPLFLLVTLLAAAACFALQKRRPELRTPALILLGAFAGLTWFSLYRTIYLSPLEKLDGATVRLHVTTTNYSEPTDYGYQVEAVAELEGRLCFLRVFQSENRVFPPGTVLEGDFRLRLTTPSGKKDSSFDRANGRFAVATQKGDLISRESEQNTLFFLPARAGRAALNNIRRLFPDDAAPFAAALLLGDTSGLSYETDTALKVSGIRHVVAVSGLHVSALFGAVYFLLRRRRVLAFLVCAPILLFFAAVTGFSPSVCRASLMAGVMALGAAVREEYDGLTSLSFAALVMLLVNPFVIASVSFQLSVASVAGILLFASPIAARLRSLFPGVKAKSMRGRALTWVSGALSVSCGAQLLSVPLSAYYFHSVSLIGFLANLLIIWMIPPLFCGIAVVAALGEVLPRLCGLLAALLSEVIRLILWMASLLSRIPFAAVYTQSAYIVAWLIVVYCLIALFLWRRRHARLLFALGALSLAAAIAASVWIPRADAVRLTALDVGEGQALLLQSRGKSYLIDCGGDSDTRTADEIAQTLLSQGIFRLDGLLLTHYDRDHTNALGHLLSRISVERFYLPETEQTGPVDALREKYSERVEWVTSDRQILLPTGILHLIAADGGKTGNENSMCVLFASEECAILITGDRGRAGERALLRNYTLPDVDVLIAGHHGANGSTSEELLRAVRPETVIISVGENNRYGHPAQELLERLTEFGCTIYRTDRDGSVVVRR